MASKDTNISDSGRHVMMVTVDELRELFRRGLVPGSEGMTEGEIEAEIARIIADVGIYVGDPGEMN